APKPRPSLLRFLWTSDAEGRLASLSPNSADLVGADAAAALIGRSWSALIGRDLIDREGGLAERLASGTTFSGHRVLWRSETQGEGVRVELSAAPLLDAARRFAGYRGFGMARLAEREPFPELEAQERDEVEVAAARESQAETDPAVAPMQVPEASADEAEILEDALDASALPPTIADEAEPASLAPDDAALATEESATAAVEPAPPYTAIESAGPECVAEIETAREASESPLLEPEDEAGQQQDAAAPEAAGIAAEPEAQPIATATADQPTALELPAPELSGPALPGPELPGPGNIVPLRNGHLTAVRPVLEPSKANLSTAERNAFREIAKALGARIAGDDEPGPRLPPVAPLQMREEAAVEAGEDKPRPVVPRAEALRQRLPNSHAELLDKLPIAVLVNRNDEALYANRTLLDLLDYADLHDMAAGGGVSRLIKGAARTDGGAMILIDRLGHLVSVDAVLSSISWQGEPATMMAFRHPDGGGEVRVRTQEEVENEELAAEFEAEEAESAARVAALRLDVDSREARIDELVAMLDTATDGVVTVDERGRMLSLNKTAEALFGYDQREVTGELFTLLFAAESHAPALDYLEGLKGGGVASVMNDGREVVGRERQGGKIPLFMTMGQIAEGPERRFCAVLRDITAWKKTEGELVEARRAAEKASAQKSDVLAKISHEIRTPLNAIIGFAEVMAEERFGPIANERYKEYLRDIHQSGGYVISLVNDLLDLAKIEAGKLDLDFVSVNLNEIALSAVALLQPEANRGRVVLRSGLSPKLPPVVADQRSIRQIVINLLSNAVKFTDAGGQVIVSTALGDQGEAILRVRDTGIGMDDNELKLALEPFRQVPTTRRAGGTGLGLPLTKALVEANRAAMSITSVKKEGTLVEITFPPQRVLAG
ncbi:MAG: ATP-binding protein, partial [Bosea sp. (in: a-proteobacteria)]